MSENPYAPPRASVDQTGNRGTRPIQVTFALRLLVANFCLGLLLDPPTTLQSAASVLPFLLFALGLLAWLYNEISLGRNWSRITLLVIIIFGGIVNANAPRSKLPLSLDYVLSVGISLVILWLLFFSAGRRWFSARKKPSSALSVPPPDAA